MEDVRGQREAADRQLAAARREREAARGLVQKAGYEGFRVERELLSNIETALHTAAAAASDREVVSKELEEALVKIKAAEKHRAQLEQQLQVQHQVSSEVARHTA